jgi:hypothetical protein
MTKFRGDRSISQARSIQYIAVAMGDRPMSSKALDLWLLAVCSFLLTLLCHSLSHPSSSPSVNSATSTVTSTVTSTAAAHNIPAPARGQRTPQFYVPARSSALDQLKSDVDE